MLSKVTLGFVVVRHAGLDPLGVRRWCRKYIPWSHSLYYSSDAISHERKITYICVAGIRMLDQPYMTDLIEANSMGHEPNLIDIYSASWGPTDDGKTVDGPRNATMRAIVRGVNEVRSAITLEAYLQWFLPSRSEFGLGPTPL